MSSPLVFFLLSKKCMNLRMRVDTTHASEYLKFVSISLYIFYYCVHGLITITIWDSCIGVILLCTQLKSDI